MIGSSRRCSLVTLCILVPALLAGVITASAGDLVPVKKVEQQPFVAATQRLLQALELTGSPLPQADADAVQAAIAETDAEKCVTGIQAALDRNCLIEVTINPESRVTAKDGPARRELIQQGWRTSLVKVINDAGVTAPLRVDSPQAEPVYQQGKGARERPSTDQKLVTAAESAQRFLDIAQYTKQPLKPELSGLNVEYRLIQLYSRDAGQREATLVFDIGQGTQDLAHRSEVPLLFQAQPSVEVVLDIKDHDGSSTTASFLIKDAESRVYPNPSRRLAPDFFFHQQIYRADGESVRLPPGEYTVQVGRGPEYVIQTHTLHVPETASSNGGTFPASFQLQRWIEPKTRGWYSGDHHVHAAGCAHYDSPTEGVGPTDMMRHVLGEDLNVGCVLSWGPCWYAQKVHFEGKVHKLSKPNYLMRYDVEVSGFPSSHAGHLCLLRLIEDDYPSTSVLEDWPSWTMPVLQWGQRQGAVVGYSHSGWGLALPDYAPDGSRIALTGDRNRTPKGGRAADTLPDYAMPAFDGIGANEYIVTVAHDACDFISAVDTPSVWELNVWYHTNNCGYRAKISGETDFPCIYGDKVGLGRIYVKLDDAKLDYDAWVQGVKLGRSYCTDGLGHIMDLKVAAASDPQMSAGPGEPGPGGEVSELKLPVAGKVMVTCDVAALLAESPNAETEAIRRRRLDQKPYWHIERARIGDTRTVPVELIVNGYPTARQEISADGSVQSLTFDVDLPISSWVAVRIFPSVHTNPVYVVVGDKPIRASRRSADWCVTAVETCWNAKRERIREAERNDAQKAYEAATAAYRKIRDESAAE